MARDDFPRDFDDNSASTVPDMAVVQPMMDARYRLTRRAATRLQNNAAVLGTRDTQLRSHTTDQLKMIDGRSLRLYWPTKLPEGERGLYGCRLLVDQKVVAVGLCNVDETRDKCELMAFPLPAAEDQHVTLLSTEVQAERFPIGMTLELVLVTKTSEFSTIAIGPWLHDHIQRSLAVLHSWSCNKQPPTALRANLAEVARSAKL